MDKFIDKLIDTSWFMKIFALILALLLFDSQYDPNKDVSEMNVPSEQDTEILEEIPVKSYYDTENLVVTGVPETVTVTVSGPRANLQQVIVQQDFEVYVDLTDAEIGTQNVPLQIRDISERLEVTVDPGSVEVTIQEKVSEDYQVEAEFNQSLLGEGYTAEQPIAEPNTVTITGGKDVVDRIAFVKATMNNLEGPITETVTEKASVSVFDRDMNKLNVVVEPAEIEVTIPVERLTKTVPIRIEEEGSPANGYSIDSITLNVDEATISGSEAVLGETENVRVEVDVSGLNADTELTLPVIISDGITAVDPEQVTVRVEVSAIDNGEDESNDAGEETQNQDQAQNTEETRTLANIPIQIAGLGENYDARFNTPASGNTSLTVRGPRNEIQGLVPNDFDLLLDLANLDEGDHEVEIDVNGPSNLSWSLAVETATITITQKEA
ncbi:CdaR family protein [Cytobacillus gottheilii]|uniref:CdaR family protein n=1 Tax=Cytobacillus gottheilii TaxID=859144 RepID=UPI0009BA74CB|nr:CdaR family protein [Cytobacillus gottheilii]